MRGNALLVGLAAAAAIAGAGTAQAATVIDTTGSWNGSDVICPFGRPNTTTYGQVVTVPAQDTALDSYTVFIRVDTPTIILRGEVYAWDGTKAIGAALWEGTARSLAQSSTPQPVTFTPGGVPLSGGQRYVLFASVSKDFEQNADPSLGCWGFTNQEVYGGGDFVFLNDGGDESLWTLTPWTTFAPTDLAFNASFRAPLPTSKEQCLNGGWKQFGVFKNQGDCVSFVATHAKNPPAGA